MLTVKDGIMIVLSSPSGSGKTTLVKLLSENELAIGYDINENLINKKKFYKYEKTQYAL